MGRFSGIVVTIDTDVDARTINMTIDGATYALEIADIADVEVVLDGVAGGDVDDLGAGDSITIPELPCTVINARSA